MVELEVLEAESEVVSEGGIETILGRVLEKTTEMAPEMAKELVLEKVAPYSSFLVAFLEQESWL